MPRPLAPHVMASTAGEHDAVREHIWSIEPSEHGAKVVFRHTGFSDEQPEYDFGSIAMTWGQIVVRLKEVVESGGAPNPPLT
jgi:hypothetical protein